MENNQHIKLGETFTHTATIYPENTIGTMVQINGAEFQQKLQFTCVCEKKNNQLIGLNSTYCYYENTNQYGQNYADKVNKITHFIKSPNGGYEIHFNNSILKLIIYETCIHYFNKFIYDEAEKQECLNLIEKLYIAYNQHHNIPLPNQQYNLK